MSLGKRILPLNLGSNMLILRNKMFDPEFQVNTSFLTAQGYAWTVKKILYCSGALVAQLCSSGVGVSRSRRV